MATDGRSLRAGGTAGSRSPPGRRRRPRRRLPRARCRPQPRPPRHPGLGAPRRATTRSPRCSRYARRRLAMAARRRRERSSPILLEARSASRSPAGRLSRPATRPPRSSPATSARSRTASRSRLPPWEMLRFAYDKRVTYALADRARASTVPWTLDPRERGRARARCRVDFPVILKPAVKETLQPAHRGEGVARRRPGRAPEPLRGGMPARRCPRRCMVQELVPGRRRGAVLLRRAVRGRSTRSRALVARRTRQYPADFGRASTFVETVDVPADRGRRRVRMLAALALHRPRRGGVQARPARRPAQAPRHQPARLGLAHARRPPPESTSRTCSGCFACGEPVPRLEGRAGVRWVRASTDLPTVVPSCSAGGSRCASTSRSLRGPRTRAIFAATTPLPGLAELPLIVSILLRRLARGGGSSVRLPRRCGSWSSATLAGIGSSTVETRRCRFTAGPGSTYSPSATASGRSRPCWQARGELGAGLPLMEVKDRIRGRRWIALPFTDRCPVLAELSRGRERARRRARSGRQRGGSQARGAIAAGGRAACSRRRGSQARARPDAWARGGRAGLLADDAPQHQESHACGP